jgi:hypothetical protein
VSVIEVAGPDAGSAYLSGLEATIYNSASGIPYPVAFDLVNTAEMFIGLPYLWGGMSGFCSGFAHTLYDAMAFQFPVMPTHKLPTPPILHQSLRLI